MVLLHLDLTLFTSMSLSNNSLTISLYPSCEAMSNAVPLSEFALFTSNPSFELIIASTMSGYPFWEAICNGVDPLYALLTLIPLFLIMPESFLDHLYLHRSTTAPLVDKRSHILGVVVLKS